MIAILVTLIVCIFTTATIVTLVALRPPKPKRFIVSEPTPITERERLIARAEQLEDEAAHCVLADMRRDLFKHASELRKEARKKD